MEELLNEFRNLDLKERKKNLATPVILDFRNIYEPERLAELGFKYSQVGRGADILLDRGA